MKTPKPIVVKSVSGAVAASILVTILMIVITVRMQIISLMGNHFLNLVRVICPKSFFTN